MIKCHRAAADGSKGLHVDLFGSLPPHDGFCDPIYKVIQSHHASKVKIKTKCRHFKSRTGGEDKQGIL